MIPNTNHKQALLTIAIMNGGINLTLSPLLGWDKRPEGAYPIAFDSPLNGANYQTYLVNSYRSTLQRIDDRGFVDAPNQQYLDLAAVIDEIKTLGAEYGRTDAVTEYLATNKSTIEKTLKDLKLIN